MFSALLAFCAENSLVTGEFPAQRPVTRSCGVFSDLRLNKRLSKQSWDWWSETPSLSWRRHCNVIWYLFYHGKSLDQIHGTLTTTSNHVASQIGKKTVESMLYLYTGNYNGLRIRIVTQSLPVSYVCRDNFFRGYWIHCEVTEWSTMILPTRAEYHKTT